MALHNKINTIIVESTSADFSAHTYTQVYSTVGGSIDLNGSSVAMVAGATLDIVLKQQGTTSLSGVYFLGSPKNTTTGSPNLGSIST